jgi:BASS family bile acid:Na+ symporter
VAFQLIPLLIGMGINERFPQVAAKLVKPFAAVVSIAIIVVLILVAPALAKAIVSVYGSNGTIAAALVVLFSLAVGWFFGGPATPYRNTLAIATALRNIGLALVIATMNFEGTPVTAMVASYFLVQVIFGTIAGKLFTRHRQAVAT